MRVLVLGAGYAGLTLARRLESSLPDHVELVVVDESGTHLVQHEVHRVVRRPSLAEAITIPLDAVLDRTEVVTGHVESLDRRTRTVHLSSGVALSYDYVAVCLGTETAFYDLPGVETHALPLKRIDHAERIRESVLAEADGGRAVVGGAGLSGVQVAGELAALADERESGGEVVLLEQEPTVAPTFPANFRAGVRRELDACGVDVRTNATVTRATADSVELDADTVAYDTFVWTGGIAGTAPMARERPLVRNDLRLDEHTFVVGDAARIVDADGEAVPASASAAIREAKLVAKNLRLLLAHEDGDAFDPRLDPYRFDVPGWIVSVGNGTVAQVGPTVVTGAAAKAMKATVGAGHLTSVGAIRQAVDLVEAEFQT